MDRPNKFSIATQRAALERQMFRCACCGYAIITLGEGGRKNHAFGEAAHAHHLRHVKHGGSNAVENCVIICESCHYSVHEGGNYRFGQADGEPVDYPHYNG